MADTVQSQNPSTHKPLTLDRLLELLNYDPETGLFTWKGYPKRRGFNRVSGTIAGTLYNGYRKIIVDGHRYYAHRLVWLTETGVWPANEVDHINRDGTDNRFSNLRLATRIQNVTNCGVYSNSTTGIKGVNRFSDGRWRARIQASGKSVFLGYFETKEEASSAYEKAAKQLHGEFANPAKCVFAPLGAS